MEQNPTYLLRLDDLPQRKATAVALAPNGAALREIANDLGLDALRKVRLEGSLAPVGRGDWELRAHLGATVVQPCVATLAPVTTRIEEAVDRVYVKEWEDLDAGEIEMPEDDGREPRPEVLDLQAVLIEALSLALPAFPRSDDAETLQMQVAPAGAAPLTDADLKPFAGLAGLRDQLAGKTPPKTDD